MWASALGRASNLVSKLSEIVAPLEDDDEQEDSKGNEYGGSMFGMDGFLSGPLDDVAVKPEPTSEFLDINLDENRSIIPTVPLPKSSEESVITSTQNPMTVLTPTATSSTSSASSSSTNERMLSTNNQRLEEEDVVRKSTIQPPQRPQPSSSSSSSSSTTPALQVDLQKKLTSMEAENKMLLQQLAQKNALLVSMESTTEKDHDASSSSIPPAIHQQPTIQSQQQEIETAAAIAEWKARIQQLELQLQEGETKHTQAQENFRMEKEQMIQRFNDKEKTLEQQVTESNVRLQECEESAWQARAEASELLHAYEHEKHNNDVLQVKLGQVEGTLAAMERAERGREKETESSRTTTSATGGGDGIVSMANMETVSLDDSTTSAVITSANGVDKVHLEKVEKEKKELLQQVERLDQQREDLETTLIQSKKETEQIRLQVIRPPFTLCHNMYPLQEAKPFK